MDKLQLEFLAKYLKQLVAHPTEDDLKYTKTCLEHGILINPLVGITREEALILIKLYGVDLRNANATFYESFEVRKGLSWGDVVVDRLLHYSATYGGLEEFFGTDFVPNSEEKVFQTAFNTHLTTIKLVDESELKESLRVFANQPLALPSSTISVLADLVGQFEIEVSESASKELQIELVARYAYIPKSPELLLRAVLRRIIKTTDFYKTKFSYRALDSDVSRLKDVDRVFVIDLVRAYIDTYGLQALADHYRPNKKTWLILRKLGLQKEVNAMKRLSEVSRKDHTFKTLVKEFPEDLSKFTNYQLIRFYNYLSELRNLVEGDYQVYRIRNGKTFVKAVKQTPISALEYILVDFYLERLKGEFKARFEGKELKFYQPEEHISIAVPTTAKSFIGVYPMYTRIAVPENYQIGIYWNQEGDIDLHARTIDGGVVSFYHEGVDGITYTGDMTRLNNQGLAAEAMLIEDVQGLTFSLQPYYQLDTDSCKVYIAESLDKDATQVVADGSLLFQASVPTDKGLVFATNVEGAVVLTNLSVGGRLPDTTTSVKLIEAVERKSQTALNLKDFAEFVGAEFVDSVKEATHDFSQQGVSVATFTDLLG